MATAIYINTDLKDLTANAVASEKRPTQIVRLPQIVEGETVSANLYLVNSAGSYDSRSGSGSVAVAVSISSRGKAATSGTFTLTDGVDTTAAINFDASAQAVEDALNALNSNTGAFGSRVIVTKLAAGSYRIIFNDAGSRADLTGTSINLAPESEVTVGTSVPGTIDANITGFTITGTNTIMDGTWTKDESLVFGKVAFSNGNNGAIRWTGTLWNFIDSFEGERYYFAPEQDTTYPWQVTSWMVDYGDGSPSFGSFTGTPIVRAQQVIEISQQPAIYTDTTSTITNGFSVSLSANNARVQQLIASGGEAFFEVKIDTDVICQVPITVLPAVAAPNSLPATSLPEGASLSYVNAQLALKANVNAPNFTGLQEHSNNTHAIAAGLSAGDVYRHGDHLMIVH